ncbi:facilitated trehalose transporter Tret1-2 homolog isoform X3 [Diabrotica virgifera virgifera]|uniref:Major facilitator superfamily (MFS) profile domain-containing protein n=1 Tax=Diabrotica virgifera virgifera TaxID=50390 RepID=A0ABM5K8W4_DIAVI|nr:facilitated trehalose transporter Tret1-2 homolog isoform X3 [Diabrotica virgifera virgifera]
MVISIPSSFFLYAAASAANIASFICGIAFGWTSPEIPQLKNATTTPLDSIITASEEGWIGAFLPLAAAVGPIGAGILADSIGRKWTILIGNVPFLLAFILNVVANSVYFFYVSRFLCGLGVGIIFTVLPMYIGEISDDGSRGVLGSLMQLFCVIGLLFSYTLGPFLSIKIFNAILIMPPTMFMILFSVFIPDSPYFLLQKKRMSDAVQALMKFRGRELSFAQKEVEVINTQLEEDLKSKGTFKLIFQSLALRKALTISLTLIGAQQLSGITVVLFYAQSIFADSGVPIAPEVCTIIVGIVQVLASAVTPLLVDKCGKRLLLMVSGLGMAVAHSILAFFFYLKNVQDADVSSLGWLPILSIVVFIITYCLGFGPLPWAVMGEIFPGNVKSIASSATASFCWILGFFLTNYFGAVTKVMGQSASFGFFGMCCVMAAAYVFKSVPETTGKSVSEIQCLLDGSIKKSLELIYSKVESV